LSRHALIRRFWADENGATAIEYCLVAGIMMVAVVSIAATGGALGSVYERVAEIVTALGGGGGGGDGGGGG
jgi:pilus assembly protein Flp/PilA